MSSSILKSIQKSLKTEEALDENPDGSLATLEASLAGDIDFVALLGEKITEAVHNELIDSDVLTQELYIGTVEEDWTLLH